MKEKYITKRDGKFGLSYKVSYQGNTKTFSEKKYGSMALKMALKYRNELMLEPYVRLAKGITVSDCFDEIKSFYNLRSETLRKYDCLYRNFIAPFGSIQIEKLKKADIIQSLNDMVETSTDNTIQRVYTIWKKIVYMANAKEYISKDVCYGIILPKSHKIRQIRNVNEIDDKLLAEINSLLGAKIMSPYDRQMFPLICTALYLTGMRPAECLALTKKDVHNGLIHINCELGSDRVDQHIVRQCKTEESVRVIPVNERLKEVIKAAIKMNKESPVLFASECGAYYWVKDVGDKITKLCASHGIRVHLYDFRHSFSTALLRAGVDPRTHQELMGHKNYTMSVNYGRSSTEDKLKALSCVK